MRILSDKPSAEQEAPYGKIAAASDFALNLAKMLLFLVDALSKNEQTFTLTSFVIVSLS